LGKIEVLGEVEMKNMLVKANILPIGSMVLENSSNAVLIKYL
jgi:hypothetical protein